MSELMENQMLATMYQVEIIIDILVKNNFITKEELRELMIKRLNSTLMDESEKLKILSLINY
jgi:hypothetical protein